MPSRLVRYPLAGVAFLALADTAIVALALPPILRELDTDVAGVAAVLGVYAVVLAVALLPAERLGRAAGIGPLGLAGVTLFGLGSLVCGLANELDVLLIARGVQALGGAALLVTAHALLVGGTGESHGLRLWRMAALLGTAAGPAIGGALTQAFGWRSIFLLQAPVALLAAPTLARSASEMRARAASRLQLVPATALALLSGSVVAALFLTVLLLISGWGYAPLEGALLVSVMPLSTLAATRVAGPAVTRAAAGSLLAASGAAALAFLPSASLAWTTLPLLAVGIGTGLALPALAGELLTDHGGREAARLLAIRHAGIALALLILAPIAQHELDTTLEQTRLEGAALILDARLDPQRKLELAPRLSESVATEEPRGGLREVFTDGREDVPAGQIEAYDRLTERADDVLVAGVNEGFRSAFLVAACLALLAAALLAPAALGRSQVVLRSAGAAALGVIAFAIATQAARPEAVVLANPCAERRLPDSGGPIGFLQDAALAAVDVVACRVGSSREELVLALVDDNAARRYEGRYGVNPRDALDLATAILRG
jgi:MFS family permease